MTAGPLSHRRAWRSGIVQQVSPARVVDLGPGYLQPELMPAGLLAEAYQNALVEFGSAALAYGDDRGAAPLRAAVAGRGDQDNVLVTAGSSHALYLLATMLAKPGDVVLVEQFGYDLGQRLLRDAGLRVVPVSMDAHGVDPSAFEDAARAHRGRIAFACMTPTFHNPTGVVVPERRRRELLAVADRFGVLIVEDDAYADLVLDGEVPPSMVDIAGHQGVVRLRTFSKSVAPGLRLGFLLADPRTVTRMAEHALFVSGGSANHLASLAVAQLIASGAYARHLAWLREQLRARRDALAGGLRAAFGPDLACDVPAGGYFLWLRSATAPESALLDAAEAAGVRICDGSRFGAGPSATVRLSYSFNPPSDLAAAGAGFAAAWQERTVKERTP